MTSLGVCLRQVLLSGELDPAEISRELVTPVMDSLEEDHILTVESLGKNCHLPGSFQVSFSSWPLILTSHPDLSS